MGLSVSLVFYFLALCCLISFSVCETHRWTCCDTSEADFLDDVCWSPSSSFDLTSELVIDCDYALPSLILVSYPIECNSLLIDSENLVLSFESQFTAQKLKISQGTLKSTLDDAFIFPIIELISISAYGTLPSISLDSIKLFVTSSLQMIDSSVVLISSALESSFISHFSNIQVSLSQDSFFAISTTTSIDEYSKIILSHDSEISIMDKVELYCEESICLETIGGEVRLFESLVELHGTSIKFDSDVMLTNSTFNYFESFNIPILEYDLLFNRDVQVFDYLYFYDLIVLFRDATLDSMSASLIFFTESISLFESSSKVFPFQVTCENCHVVQSHDSELTLGGELLVIDTVNIYDSSRFSSSDVSVNELSIYGATFNCESYCQVSLLNHYFGGITGTSAVSSTVLVENLLFPSHDLVNLRGYTNVLIKVVQSFLDLNVQLLLSEAGIFISNNSIVEISLPNFELSASSFIEIDQLATLHLHSNPTIDGDLLVHGTVIVASTTIEVVFGGIVNCFQSCSMFFESIVIFSQTSTLDSNGVIEILTSNVDLNGNYFTDYFYCHNSSINLRGRGEILGGIFHYSSISIHPDSSLAISASIFDSEFLVHSSGLFISKNVLALDSTLYFSYDSEFDLMELSLYNSDLKTEFISLLTFHNTLLEVNNSTFILSSNTITGSVNDVIILNSTFDITCIDGCELTVSSLFEFKGSTSVISGLPVTTVFLVLADSELILYSNFIVENYLKFVNGIVEVFENYLFTTGELLIQEDYSQFLTGNFEVRDGLIWSSGTLTLINSSLTLALHSQSLITSSSTLNILSEGKSTLQVLGSIEVLSDLFINVGVMFGSSAIFSSDNNVVFTSSSAISFLESADVFNFSPSSFLVLYGNWDGSDLIWNSGSIIFQGDSIFTTIDSINTLGGSIVFNCTETQDNLSFQSIELTESFLEFIEVQSHIDVTILSLSQSSLFSIKNSLLAPTFSSIDCRNSLVNFQNFDSFLHLFSNFVSDYCTIDFSTTHPVFLQIPPALIQFTGIDPIFDVNNFNPEFSINNSTCCATDLCQVSMFLDDVYSLNEFVTVSFVKSEHLQVYFEENLLTVLAFDNSLEGTDFLMQLSIPAVDFSYSKNFELCPPSIEHYSPIDTAGGVLNIYGENFGLSAILHSPSFGMLPVLSMDHFSIESKIPEETGCHSIYLTRSLEPDSIKFDFCFSVPHVISHTVSSFPLSGTVSFHGSSFGKNVPITFQFETRLIECNLTSCSDPLLALKTHDHFLIELYITSLCHINSFKFNSFIIVDGLVSDRIPSSVSFPVFLVFPNMMPSSGGILSIFHTHSMLFSQACYPRITFSTEQLIEFDYDVPLLPEAVIQIEILIKPPIKYELLTLKFHLTEDMSTSVSLYVAELAAIPVTPACFVNIPCTFIISSPDLDFLFTLELSMSNDYQLLSTAFVSNGISISILPHVSGPMELKLCLSDNNCFLISNLPFVIELIIFSPQLVQHFENSDRFELTIGANDFRHYSLYQLSTVFSFEPQLDLSITSLTDSFVSLQVFPTDFGVYFLALSTDTGVYETLFSFEYGNFILVPDFFILNSLARIRSLLPYSLDLLIHGKVFIIREGVNLLTIDTDIPLGNSMVIIRHFSSFLSFQIFIHDASFSFSLEPNYVSDVVLSDIFLLDFTGTFEVTKDCSITTIRPLAIICHEFGLNYLEITTSDYSYSAPFMVEPPPSFSLNFHSIITPFSLPNQYDFTVEFSTDCVPFQIVSDTFNISYTVSLSNTLPCHAYVSLDFSELTAFQGIAYESCFIEFGYGFSRQRLFSSLFVFLPELTSYSIIGTNPNTLIFSSNHNFLELSNHHVTCQLGSQSFSAIISDNTLSCLEMSSNISGRSTKISFLIDGGFFTSGEVLIENFNPDTCYSTSDRGLPSINLSNLTIDDCSDCTHLIDKSRCCSHNQICDSLLTPSSTITILLSSIFDIREVSFTFLDECSSSQLPLNFIQPPSSYSCNGISNGLAIHQHCTLFFIDFFTDFLIVTSGINLRLTEIEIYGFDTTVCLTPISLEFGMTSSNNVVPISAFYKYFGEIFNSDVDLFQYVVSSFIEVELFSNDCLIPSTSLYASYTPGPPSSLSLSSLFFSIDPSSPLVVLVLSCRDVLNHQVTCSNVVVQSTSLNVTSSCTISECSLELLELSLGSHSICLLMNGVEYCSGIFLIQKYSSRLFSNVKTINPCMTNTHEHLTCSQVIIEVILIETNDLFNSSTVLDLDSLSLSSSLSFSILSNDTLQIISKPLEWMEFTILYNDLETNFSFSASNCVFPKVQTPVGADYFCGCSPGFYFNSLKSCSPCPMGTYNSDPFSSFCFDCPLHKVTSSIQSNLIDDCVCPLNSLEVFDKCVNCPSFATCNYGSFSNVSQGFLINFNSSSPFQQCPLRFLCQDNTCINGRSGRFCLHCEYSNSLFYCGNTSSIWCLSTLMITLIGILLLDLFIYQPLFKHNTQIIGSFGKISQKDLYSKAMLNSLLKEELISPILLGIFIANMFTQGVSFYFFHLTDCFLNFNLFVTIGILLFIFSIHLYYFKNNFHSQSLYGVFLITCAFCITFKTVLVYFLEDLQLTSFHVLPPVFIILFTWFYKSVPVLSQSILIVVMIGCESLPDLLMLSTKSALFLVCLFNFKKLNFLFALIGLIHMIVAMVLLVFLNIRAF
ncbi:hypothetical protein RCL1_004911 [Eukaryota sp. TZLM3-RCL]